jgi:hypothetical protein
LAREGPRNNRVAPEIARHVSVHEPFAVKSPGHVLLATQILGILEIIENREAKT